MQYLPFLGQTDKRKTTHAQRALSFFGLLLLAVGILAIIIPIASSQSQQNSQIYSRNLTLGARGDDVSSLQSFLITQGFLTVANPTGYFGALTATALSKWQAGAGLPSTGFFGPLSRGVIGTTPSVAATPPTPAPTPAQNSFDRNLTIGDQGNDVLSLQSFLIAKGFLTVPAPTGYFGVLTANAVAAWQGNTGLPPTGYFGPLSRNTVTTETIQGENSSSPGSGVTTPLPTTPNPTTSPQPINNNLGGGGGDGGGGGGGSPPPTPTPDTTPPTILITSPSNNATVSATITVTATASDDVGVIKVELYVDGNLKSTNITVSSPYALPLDTKTLTNGTHVLNAKAYDAAGNVGTAGNVTIIVNNADVTAPSIPSGLTATAASSSQINLSWSASTDNVAVVGYKIFRGGVQIATTAGISYQDRGLASSTSYTYTVAAYDAAGNISAQSASASATTPGTADVTLPTVSITNPANNATVSSTITVTATASDNVGVASVQFTLDGANLGSLITASPYQLFWNTLSAATGTHALAAIAKDAAGNSKTATSVTVTVVRTPADTTPPTVSITSPAPSSTISATITVAANASDDVGVTKVEFYLDGVLKTTVSASPYSFSLDTRPLALGAHTFMAKAYDAAGNITTSGNVGVTVIPTAPTVPSGLTITGVTSSSVSLSWSASTEAGGTVAGYKLYRGGPQVATSTVTNFTNNGLASSTTYTYAVSAYDTAGNTSATSTSVTATTLAAPALNYNFGFAVGESLVGLSNATLNQRLDDIVSLGIGWLRFDIQWNNVQWNNSSNYDWADLDQFIAAASARHIKLLPILDYTPAWAVPQTCAIGNEFCAPSDPAPFATFAKAAVARYTSQGITTWEVWNEPNLQSFWQPAANPATYTALLRATYTAIKSQNPSAVVIAGGLAPAGTNGADVSPTDFLTQMYANGAEPYFDAVTSHPYTFPSLPSDNINHAWAQMSRTTPSLRSIMTANGDGNKKIWMTEFGAPTNGPDPNWYISEAAQSTMMSDAFQLYKTYTWAGPLFWYTYKDGGTATSTNENFFGVVRYDGSDKPAYTTLKNLLAQ